MNFVREALVHAWDVSPDVFTIGLVIRSGLVLITALFLAALFRRASAAFRHLLVVTAQTVAIGMPLLWWTTPHWPLLPQIAGPFDSVSHRTPANAAAATENETAVVDLFHSQGDSTRESRPGFLHPRAGGPAEAIPAHEPTRDAVPVPAETAEGTALPAVASAPVGQKVPLPRMKSMLTVIWLIGSLALAARLLVGALRLRVLETRSSRSVDPGIQRLFDELRCEAAPGRPSRLVVAEQCSMPMVWGVLRPVVLIPPDVAQGPAAQLRSVLVHELSHVQRHDPLTRLIGQMCAILYWFNPLAWMALKKASLLAEQASDDRVLECGILPSEYAQHLMTVVRATSRRSHRIFATAMARPSWIRRRITAILDDSVHRTRPDRRIVAVAALIGGCLALPITTAESRPAAEHERTTPSQAAARDDGASDSDSVAAAAAERSGRADAATVALSSAEAGRDSTAAATWQRRRSRGFPYVAGRVVDANGQPAAGVDVGTRWNVFPGDMAPSGWVVTDTQGRFEIPVFSRRTPVVVMAMDEARENGGLAVIEKREIDPQAATNRAMDGPPDEQDHVAGVEIRLSPLVDVRGSYITPDAGRRPRHVWTSVALLPQEVQVVETESRLPNFALRLPAGTYRLRGNSAHFEDVYRTLELKAGQQPVELADMQMSVSREALLYGKPAPDWQFTDTQGIEETAKLSDYRGKWVVLEFWGVWCGPCIFQMEQLFMFSKKHEADRDRFEIITVHHDIEDATEDLPTRMTKLLNRWERDKFPYPVAVDATNQTLDRYGVDRFPTTIFIDPEGHVTRVNGIWGLSEILKGRSPQLPGLFADEAAAETAEPEPIEPSNSGGGVKWDQFIAFNGHEDVVWAVEFLPSGQEFVTAGSDSALRFWNVESGKQTRLLRCTPKGKSWSSYGGIQAFVSQDGRWVGGLYYDVHDKLIAFPRLWDAESGYESFVSVRDPDVTFGDVALSADGRRIAAFTYRKEPKGEDLSIYDVSSGTLVKSLDVHGDRRDDAGSSSAVRFSPDSRSLAVSGDKGHSIQLWDIESGQMEWEEHPRDAYGVNSISFSPDGEILAIATWHEPLEIRETGTGQLLHTLREAGHRPVHVAMSPDGRYVAVAGTGSRPTIRIWSRQTGQTVGTLIGHPIGTPAEDLAWSPDSRNLVTVSGAMHRPGEVLLWDLVAGGIVTGQ